ncbi:hypothetical protein Megvenef_01515 [Candidatus Megaera venefica]|uniref:Uncharacterized protein n=1 Tax=Candidatus Megaera venefica TaxID=2055910 RepID=A0ABU5NED5_9RICK|nr:hypothetical protein [Candidatus Megaera venefica]MEA0971535.1 hypothetical protein [Candidatus Megaera venefica]
MSKSHTSKDTSLQNQIVFSDNLVIRMANKLAENVYASPPKTRQAAFDIVFSKESPSDILFVTQFIKSLINKITEKLPDDWSDSQLNESILKFLDSKPEAVVLFQELKLIKIVTIDKLPDHLLMEENKSLESLSVKTLNF